MYWYIDGTMRGRYDYANQIDLTKSVEDIILDLCYEFKHSLHHRKSGSADWFELCKELNIEIC